MEDVIAIEQRLSQVRYELESMESQLRTLDNQIDYSTVYLSIQEVKRLTPTQEKTVWDRMKSGFVKTIYRIGDGFEYGAIWFVINIPYFIIWIIVIVLAFLLLRAIFRRKKRKAGALEQLKDSKWNGLWNRKTDKDAAKAEGEAESKSVENKSGEEPQEAEQDENGM